MKQARVLAVAGAVAVCVSATAYGQTVKRKPGLWEAQMTTAGQGMPNLQEQFANMPPEQRAQMEAIMKQRGMSVGAQGSAMTVKFCLSEKDAADETGRGLMSQAERDGSKCEHKVLSRSATEMKIHAVCKTNRGPSEFDMRVYDITPVSMSMEMNGRTADRGEVRMQQKARWLGSDCGTVK